MCCDMINEQSLCYLIERSAHIITKSSSYENNETKLTNGISKTSNDAIPKGNISNNIVKSGVLFDDREGWSFVGRENVAIAVLLVQNSERCKRTVTHFVALHHIITRFS